MPPYEARTLSPVLPVADMKRSLRFCTAVLSITAGLESDTYSIVTRGSACLHLTLAADDTVLERTRGHMSIYLEVTGIDSLWPHVSQFKGRHKIRDLFDRDYGMREFHIHDPDDCLIFVSEEIQKQ
jgi:hypothetical protein